MSPTSYQAAPPRNKGVFYRKGLGHTSEITKSFMIKADAPQQARGKLSFLKEVIKFICANNNLSLPHPETFLST
jgi:hypothetical protein